MQQLVNFGDVGGIGRGSVYVMNQAGLGVNANVGFHAEVPLLAFLGLVHVRIPFALGILGRAGRIDQGCIDDGTLPESQPFGGVVLVDRAEQNAGELVFLRKCSSVVSSGTASIWTCAKCRMEAISYRLSSTEGSDSECHCCRQ